MDGLAEVLAEHEPVSAQGWVWCSDPNCGWREDGDEPFTAHQAALVRVHLAALAQDGRVRERTAKAANVATDWELVEGYDTKAADAAVAAFLAAVEEGL